MLTICRGLASVRSHAAPRNGEILFLTLSNNGGSRLADTRRIKALLTSTIFFPICRVSAATASEHNASHPARLIRKADLENIKKEGSSVWVVIRGVVYDVGAFSALSPPCGETSINALNGEDATKHFEAVTHSAEAKTLLQNMAIGTYVDPDTDPVLECDVHSMGSPLTETEYVLAYYLALNSRNSAAVETEAEKSVLQWLRSPLFHGGLFEVPYEEEKVRIDE